MWFHDSSVCWSPSIGFNFKENRLFEGCLSKITIAGLENGKRNLAETSLNKRYKILEFSY